MKKSLEGQLEIFEKDILDLKEEISQQSNTAIKNIFITFLNDKIQQENRLIESSAKDCPLSHSEVLDQWQSEIDIQKQNKDLLKRSPALISIIARRNKYSLSKLVQMASIIESDPPEIMELERISDLFD